MFKLHKMPDSSSDQESQPLGYDSNPDSDAFPHHASTHIQDALRDGPHSEAPTAKKKKPAYPDGYPKEAFDLFKNFPGYPTSGSKDDQLNFVAAKLNDNPPFPKEEHALWREHYDEFPFLLKDQQDIDDLIVKTMRTWSEDSTSKTSKKQRRMKKVCEIDVLKRRVANGAEAVQLIRPDFERIPDFERKLASLIESCVEHEQVSSVELQVCCCVISSSMTANLPFCLREPL